MCYLVPSDHSRIDVTSNIGGGQLESSHKSECLSGNWSSFCFAGGVVFLHKNGIWLKSELREAVLWAVMC